MYGIRYYTFDSWSPKGDEDHGLLLVTGSCRVSLPHEDAQLGPKQHECKLRHLP